MDTRRHRNGVDGFWATTAALLVGFSLLVTACGSADAAGLPFVDLETRTAAPAAAPSEIAPIRIAVAAMLSPESNFESYRALADYIGDATGRPVELIQRRTYAEVNDLIAADQVDMAFVCTSAYVTGHDEFGMKLLAAPQIKNALVYYAVVIVPMDSDAQDFPDLRGEVFAFTDPLSHTGRAYPTYLVTKLGETPETFFGRTFYTYSHDRAVYAVADHVAGAASVDSLVLDALLERDPGLGDRIRVIHRSGAFGVPPVVVSPNISPQQEMVLRDLMFGLSDTAAGREVLRQLGVDRFVPAADEDYAGVREVLPAVEPRS